MQQIQKITPVVWAIGGSDSGGGAGVQADLKTLSAMGVHGATVLTGITAQNPLSIIGVELASEAMLQAQITALKAELAPGAVKIGMVGSAALARSLASTLSDRGCFVVCDPVLTSTSGTTLTNAEGMAALKKYLFPITDLLTPNIAEAEAFLGRKIFMPEEIERAASDLLKQGVKAVLIKGGDRLDDFARDYWTDGETSAWITSPRRMVPHPHGTGCTLAAAIAAGHALGFKALDAVVLAKSYVNRALRLSSRIGRGLSALGNETWPLHATSEDFPWLTHEYKEQREEAFVSSGPAALGFYPVVDSVPWVERMLALGVDTMQLRIKPRENVDDEMLEREVREAVVMAKQQGCRLFINDHWEMALRLGAYGVHLGQEDLRKAPIEKLRKAKLRLGISTHTYSEVAYAHSLQPSYIAIGPIFPPFSKRIAYAPQGVAGLRLWRQLLDCPLVAIGGITLEKAAELKEAGADGIAVMADLARSEAVETRTRGWQTLFED